MALAAVACAVAAASLVVHAQFASRVTLVEVYATVTDPAGRPVTGLEREAFRVTDGGQPRDIDVFAAGDFPLSVAIAIDRSWSMAGEPLERARSAARQFLGELRADDEAALIGISSEVETLAPLSRDRRTQLAALDELRPWGSTKLHDALLESITRVEAAQGRRALLVLSDGEDRGSRASADEVVQRARRTPVLIYPVTVSRRNPPLMAQLASFTGGAPSGSTALTNSRGRSPRSRRNYGNSTSWATDPPCLPTRRVREPGGASRWKLPGGC